MTQQGAITPRSVAKQSVATPSKSSGYDTRRYDSSRYEAQKQRDWNTFVLYAKNHQPPIYLSKCVGSNVIDFLKTLDELGKTKVHVYACPYYGYRDSPNTCACPLRQAWGSLDALVGRLRAAYEENGGTRDANPFASQDVRKYLMEVRVAQSKARGIPLDKKSEDYNSFPSYPHPPPVVNTPGLALVPVTFVPVAPVAPMWECEAISSAANRKAAAAKGGSLSPEKKTPENAILQITGPEFTGRMTRSRTRGLLRYSDTPSKLPVKRAKKAKDHGEVEKPKDNEDSVQQVEKLKDHEGSIEQVEKPNDNEDSMQQVEKPKDPEDPMPQVEEPQDHGD
ncbi:hypothetical protein AMTRI_Chr08g166290 [Amborella trichopoda]|uniref:ALOG domain-containing protein n=1 Tax=Amborella trichopoda TaxID=13333 RepID=W1PP78_AMBTC|nr:protein G1-like8 [Amborella trichopoda]ERN08990.1 hypothetical protein AMTR_s00153p00050640 [Amborella trichopoda]|eukprot:XP_006847409.1 protein G1-like8 [Amborella trichopoda]